MYYNMPPELITALTRNSLPETHPELPPIWLTKPELLEKMQLGYRIHGITDEDLTGSADGDWQPDWYVIGEGLCGDPLFVDISEKEQGFPVYTAQHGAGRWDAVKAANSIAAFVEIIRLLNEAVEDDITDTEGFFSKIECFTDDLAMWEECLEGIIEARNEDDY